MQEFLEQVIRQAGAITLEFRHQLPELKIDRKSAKDLVTDADRAVENFLVTEIQSRYPEHEILGEETGSHGHGEYCWVVDPIDGTNSFVHGQIHYSISIALKKNGKTLLGAVYGPVMDQLYTAGYGQGAFCNGRKLNVSSCDILLDSMLGTGFACLRSDRQYNNLPFFVEIMPKIRGVRRYGSVALDLCYVASGLLDGFWELHLTEMDVAAGKLIVEEAGGIVTDFDRQTEKIPEEIVATNGLLHQPLLDCIDSVRQKL